MCDAIISAYFKSLSPKLSTNDKIKSFLVYPRTKNLKDESFQHSCFYSCNEDKQCDFTSCIESFKNESNENLKKEAMRFIDVIKNPPNDHLPDVFDGFRITYSEENSKSINFLSMKNSKTKQETRTGVYDLNNVRLKCLNQ